MIGEIEKVSLRLLRQQKDGGRKETHGKAWHSETGSVLKIKPAHQRRFCISGAGFDRDSSVCAVLGMSPADFPAILRESFKCRIHRALSSRLVFGRYLELPANVKHF